MNSGTVATSKRTVMKPADHAPNASEERSMEHRTPGRTGIDNDDARVDAERKTGL
ncbi:MAG: hypothetical protein JWO62_1379 [Acidimicrobiaceae bacterium]|nr:hypothetical protein [Acidimicrobiaceae bacterium]